MPTLTSFRRLTDPLQIPVGPTAQLTIIPRGYIPPEAEAFWVCNPNGFWVRLRGSGTNTINGNLMSGDARDVIGDEGMGTGWYWPPGFVGGFGTQFPRFVSTISTGAQDLTAGSGYIELSWGSGL